MDPQESSIYEDACAEKIKGDRLVFRRRHRISGSEQFALVFDAKLRKSRGPISVFLLPTDRDEHRLGLSVGRKAGNAVVRGRFKRMIRESFRLQRGEIPNPKLAGVGDDAKNSGGSYDIVVSTRKHDALTLDEYKQCFLEAVLAAHRTHCKRVDSKRTSSTRNDS